MHDLTSYRRWVKSDACPEHGQFAYLDGHLWMDLTMERWIQNQIKKEFDRVLTNLEKGEELGYYVGDRMLRGESGLAIGNELDDTIEVTGSPDMMLELVSSTSVDTTKGVLFKLAAHTRKRERPV